MSEPARSSVGARRNPETETAVLDAAAAIIAEDGFQKLTMEAVARRARAGKATVYRWWPSRGHLLLAVYSRAKATFTEPDTGDLATDLTEYVAQMLRQAHGGDGQEPLGPILRLLIAEAQLDDTLQAAMQQERQERWLHIDNIIKRAQDRGQLNPAISLNDAEKRVISLYWYHLLNGTLPLPQQAAEFVSSMLVDLRA
ncbi:TetR/AcrR family transcriptional regulator [Paracoccus sp. 11-3]|uniref:TetR/AcrR family transcriptional regulator n=1 Tax=Paracoccus amoyensis TaxID=2760093 RepID=A0A926GEQ5_9RHOB|nr:TetR/AcrR family transcriptional regulator [Paracoccus amoyensis]MBC9247830.1 TetR/AcrR family transcriptional regulator [Paracoccus amoyensis]